MKTASSLHQTTAYMDMLPSLAIISEIAHQYICSPRTNAHTNSNTMATRRTNKNLGFNPLPIDHHFARCDRGRPQSIQYRSNRIAHPGNSCHIELHIYIYIYMLSKSLGMEIWKRILWEYKCVCLCVGYRNTTRRSVVLYSNILPAFGERVICMVARSRSNRCIYITKCRDDNRFPFCDSHPSRCGIARERLGVATNRIRTSMSDGREERNRFHSIISQWPSPESRREPRAAHIDAIKRPQTEFTISLLARHGVIPPRPMVLSLLQYLALAASQCGNKTIKNAVKRFRIICTWTRRLRTLCARLRYGRVSLPYLATVIWFMIKRRKINVRAALQLKFRTVPKRAIGRTHTTIGDALMGSFTPWTYKEIAHPWRSTTCDRLITHLYIYKSVITITP